MMPATGEGARKPAWLPAATLPDCFRDLSAPPAGLWCVGDATALEGAKGRHVAIVGTREASAYGERTARRLAAACVRKGLIVVSGLARGIDAAAHRGALEAGGRTIAVMGTGADVPYPVGHRVLHGQVAAQGAVLSEMEPGAPAGPGCFPRRNRLIAALAEVTVVVEAGFKSGAINTANHSMELGRTVAAVPGMIDDPRAAGSNHLLRDGAQVITDVEDLLGLYKLSTNSKRIDGQSIEFADTVDAALFRLLGPREQTIDDIAFRSGLSSRQTAERLTKLELEGLVERIGVGYRRSLEAVG